MTSSFVAHGTTFRITSPDADVVSVFDDLLVDMRVADDAGHTIDIHPIRSSTATGNDVTPTFRVRFDDETVYATLNGGSLVSHVLMEINQRAAASVWSRGSVPLHASAASGPGGAIVLPGVSHSGKTTLGVALALAAGLETGFLADEVCALDATDLVVSPYGKPAALRAPGTGLMAPRVARLRHPGGPYERDERFVPPSELGTRPLAPVPIGAIVFPRVGSSTTTSGESPRLQSVAPVEALTRLMRLTLGSEPVDVETFRTLERLVRDVAAYDLAYTDSIEATAHLVDALGGQGSS